MYQQEILEFTKYCYFNILYRRSTEIQGSVVFFTIDKPI